MTAENKKRVYNSLIKMEALAPSIVAMVDTLAKIGNEFTNGSGFKGDFVLIEAAGYLSGAVRQLESASAGMLSKLRESKELIEKQEAELSKGDKE